MTGYLIPRRQYNRFFESFNGVADAECRGDTDVASVRDAASVPAKGGGAHQEVA